MGRELVVEGWRQPGSRGVQVRSSPQVPSRRSLVCRGDKRWVKLSRILDSQTARQPDSVQFDCQKLANLGSNETHKDVRDQ